MTEIPKNETEQPNPEENTAKTVHERLNTSANVVYLLVQLQRNLAELHKIELREKALANRFKELPKIPTGVAVLTYYKLGFLAKWILGADIPATKELIKLRKLAFHTQQEIDLIIKQQTYIEKKLALEMYISCNDSRTTDHYANFFCCTYELLLRLDESIRLLRKAILKINIAEQGGASIPPKQNRKAPTQPGHDATAILSMLGKQLRHFADDVCHCMSSACHRCLRQQAQRATRIVDQHWDAVCIDLDDIANASPESRPMVEQVLNITKDPSQQIDDSLTYGAPESLAQAKKRLETHLHTLLPVKASIHQYMKSLIQAQAEQLWTGLCDIVKLPQEIKETPFRFTDTKRPKAPLPKIGKIKSFLPLDKPLLEHSKMIEEVMLHSPNQTDALIEKDLEKFGREF